jgi:hypothetical protein
MMDEKDTDTAQTIPTGIVNPISNIQIELYSGIVTPMGFGLPIMREGFITETGPLLSSGPVRQFLIRPI